MKVERVIKVYLTREGIDIPEERLSSIVLELKSWLKPSLEGSGIIKTQEGMVGKEEKEDSSERQWEGSGV